MKKIKLKNIAELKYGQPSGSEKENAYPFITPKALNVNNDVTIDYKQIYKVGVNAKKIQLLKGNELLFSAKGSFKGALFDGEPDKFVASASFIVLRPKKEVYPLYLKFLLNSEMLRHVFRGKTDGSTIPSISIKELGNLEINLPSYENQVKIAKMMQEYSKAEELLNQKINILKKQKDYIFKSLQSGKMNFNGDKNG